VTSLFRALWDDDGALAAELLACNGDVMPLRSAFARGMLETANNPVLPMARLALWREFADRLDGKPTQHKEVRESRVTVMYKRGDPP
jgi:hypothetical protein